MKMTPDVGLTAVSTLKEIGRLIYLINISYDGQLFQHSTSQLQHSLSELSPTTKCLEGKNKILGDSYLYICITTYLCILHEHCTTSYTQIPCSVTLNNFERLHQVYLR